MRDCMKYINHLGEVIEFGKGSILINENDFRDYEWTYLSENEKITGFKKGIITKELPVIVYGKNAKEIADDIFEKIEKDVVSNKKGKMYVGDYYITGRFITASYEGYTKAYSIEFTLKFVVEEGTWIKEAKKQFYPQEEQDDSVGFDFPMNFPIDFAATGVGYKTWNVDHYTKSHFEMTIYGPCVNPRVLINEYPYQIFTELQKGEYLILSSRENTVIKVLSDSSQENIYNSRQFYPSVFEKIPNGNLEINWSGKFGFDITLYLERSKPKW